MKLVIKVGTQAIVDEKSQVREKAMLTLVAQIAALKQQGCQVILVSSGAVGSGRRVGQARLGASFGETTVEKQVLSSLGQPALMGLYTELFSVHALLVGQVLLTKQDFQTRAHYLNISKIFKKMLEHAHIIPVVNENDSVSIEELIFTDNDELAGLIAALLGAHKLIILTSVNGVYDGHPSEAGSTLIPVIDPAKDNNWPTVSSMMSTQGRGGMISKLGIAKKLSQLGITTHIANIDEENALLKIFNNESIGTVILAQKKASSIKRWISFCDWQKTGAIYVNVCLFELLKKGERAISILPIGIDRCEGDFKKGDLIEIMSPGHQQIGIGIARYDSELLSSYLGKKDKPEIIHYDHLMIKIGK